MFWSERNGGTEKKATREEKKERERKTTKGAMVQRACRLRVLLRVNKERVYRFVISIDKRVLWR